MVGPAATAESGGDAARARWLGLLARANPPALAERMVDAEATMAPLPDRRWLRPPEIGSVMLRGRTAGTGAPFNLGEMTVTRCTLAFPDGTVGHAMVPGRDKAHAERVALADALLQRVETRAAVEKRVLEPLATVEEAAARETAAKAAATKVEFFTMVRGEDQ
ncbi:MAG: phosphonate C-P lyase system protein PhnG [Pseudomonadota bacterium]